MLSIYITEQALEHLILDQARWYKILGQKIELYLDLSSDDMDKYAMDDEEDLISNYIRSADITPIAAKSQFEAMVHDPKTVLSHPSAIFILNVTKEEAQRIQKTYGVLCFSEQAIAQDALSYRKSVFCQKESSVHSWESILESSFLSNALLINDRYMFVDDRVQHSKDTREERYISPGVDNVVEIIHRAIPQDFNGEYHVFIAFQKGRCKLDFTQLSKLLNDRVDSLKQSLKQPDVRIRVELFSYERYVNSFKETHDRFLVTNYAYISATHGFTAFNDQGRAKFTQNLSYKQLFSEGIDDNSDCPLNMYNYVIEVFRKMINHELADRGKNKWQNVEFSQNNNFNLSLDQIDNRLFK